MISILAQMRRLISELRESRKWLSIDSPKRNQTAEVRSNDTATPLFPATSQCQKIERERETVCVYFVFGANRPPPGWSLPSHMPTWGQLSKCSSVGFPQEETCQRSKHAADNAVVLRGHSLPVRVGRLWRGLQTKYQGDS